MIATFNGTVPTDVPRRYRATDGSQLRTVADEFWHRGASTGGGWTRVPLGALADLFATADAETKSAADSRVAQTVADCFAVADAHVAAMKAALGHG